MTIGAYPPGSHAVSGLPGASFPEVLQTPALFIVEGVSYSTWDTITIDDTLQGRSTCTIRLIDFEMAYHFSPGLDVQVWWNGKLCFAGTIDSVEEEVTERNDADDVIFVELECVDWNQLLDRFYVAADYPNKTVRQIVEDVLTNQTLLKLEGVEIGEVDSEVVIESIQFNYKKVTSVFTDISAATGLTWNIDYTKKLHFFDRATFAAPFTIGDAGRKDYRGMSYSKDRQQYRNRELLRGGHDLTDNQFEQFRGDSAGTEPEDRRRTFNLKYEVGEMISITRGGVPQNIGVRQIDKDGDLEVVAPVVVNPSVDWPQWFYTEGEKEISQNSERDEVTNPTLTAEEVLEVTYKGRFPMLIIEDNESEIAARQAVEGGTGVYEFLDNDDDLMGREFAKIKARRLLEQYGRIPAELKVQMDIVDLVPGHLLTIELAEFGITPREFLIDSVQTEFIAHVLPRSTFTLLDGERVQGWADYFRKLAEAGKSKVLRKNEVIVKTSRLNEQINIADTLIESAHAHVNLIPYTSDPYTWAWFGVFAVSFTNPVDIPCAFVFGRSRFGKHLFQITTNVFPPRKHITTRRQRPPPNRGRARRWKNGQLSQ